MAFYPEREANSRAVGAANVVFAWLCAGCRVWEGEEEEEEDGGSDFENVHLVLGYFDVWMQSYILLYSSNINTTYIYCWKNSIEWIKNWCFLVYLKMLLKMMKILSLTSKKKVGLLVQIMSWLLGWTFDICEVGLLVQIIIFIIGHVRLALAKKLKDFYRSNPAHIY